MPARRSPKKHEREKDERPEAEDEAQPLRGIWSGSITFGLVTIPVELHSVTRSRGTPMRMLGPAGAPLQRRFACPEHDEVLDAEDIARGYEVGDGEYVIVTDEELEKIAPRRSRDIDLERFVPRSSIDPAYLDRAYLLVPGEEQTKAYRLLAETMERTERAAIATFVMRNKGYAVAIFADQGVLRAATLRFADEVRTPDEAGLPKAREADDARVRKLKKAIAALAKPKLVDAETAELEEDDVRDIALAKKKRGKDVVEVEAVMAEPDAEDEGGEVVDLMQRIRERLRGDVAKRPKAASPRPRRSAARKRAAPKPRARPKSRAKTTRSRRA